VLRAALVTALATALAAATYLGLERLGRRAWVPLACRAVAWTAIGLLLLDVSCPVRSAPRRPLVLLDASLSLGAAGGRWPAARDSARRWGDVRTFGDERAPGGVPPAGDSAPTWGRSLLAPALAAAAATDRPVLVVTDGEIEDSAEIPRDLLARAGVRLFRRAAVPDLALTGLVGPARVTLGDSIVLTAEVTAHGRTWDSAVVEVRAGGARVARRVVRLAGGSGGRAALVVPSARLGPGERLLRVGVAAAGDAEPRTDERLHLVIVAPTPGVVVLAAPPDWDSRFLFRALREVGRLPTRGYVRIAGDRWLDMDGLRPVAERDVRRAARGADLLVTAGAVGGPASASRARGVWQWVSGAEVGALPGDWYLSAAEASPVAGAFAGLPVDSFPPAVQLVPLETRPGEWVALSAQLARRGVPRPAVVGRDEGGRRRVAVGVQGLWRWVFRGGTSEQAYRSWVAATASWLLGAADTAAGLARPARAVVANGRPLVFEWVGPGRARATAVTWSGARDAPADTLRFDGAGRALVWLAPGEYRYRLAGGGAGLVAVERYSEELLPRPVVLAERPAPPVGGSARTSARDLVWLFGLCLVALFGEWLARRRLGLR
jgi:hypothetical protein